MHFSNVSRAVLATLLCAALPAHAQLTEQIDRGQTMRDGRQWDYSVRKLPPASFPALPAALRQELERRQCMIPQTYQARAPENVIAGEFLEKGMRAWAVLCSRDGSSTLLVFGNDPVAAPAELGTRKDAETTVPQIVAAGLGFAWGIDTVHPSRIRGLQLKPDRYDHDGVEDAILSRGSSIHYCQQGKWTQLMGDN